MRCQLAVIRAAHTRAFDLGASRLGGRLSLGYATFLIPEEGCLRKTEGLPAMPQRTSPIVSFVPILLQKSKIARRRIFRETIKQETIADFV